VHTRTATRQAHEERRCETRQRLGERILFKYHLLLQSRIDLGRGDVAAARRSLESGTNEARQQGSLWMEVRLLASLCELPDASKLDFAALKQAYERLPEGFGTAVVSRARELLGTASP
jgi:hypothetical protein